MIEFCCKHCGQVINVTQIQAGKRAVCPQCGNTIRIPKADSVEETINRDNDTDSETTSDVSPYDLTLLEVPLHRQVQNEPIDQAAELEKASELWPRFGKEPAGNKIESNTQRKLPWLFDVFLYPTSKAGLVTIAVVTIIRLFFRIMVRAMGESTRTFPPFLVFLAVLVIIGFIVRFILYIYLYWYFCECVRNSAAGGVRAPEILGLTPGLGEMLWRMIRTIFCLGFFLGPMLFYFLKTGERDTVFWCLAAYGVFFFPMSLLAFVMFDSTQALNPILLIGSILSTFLPYCAMIAVFMAAGMFILERVPPPHWPSGTLFVIWCVGIYLAMIAAHLLGWFYHRYENELNWDI